MRSPTGLVLEFPTSEYLVTWSAIVDNPAPYQVSRGGEEWTSLAEFLRLVRQGKRGTSAFQTAALATATMAEVARPAEQAPAAAAPAGRPSARTERLQTPLKYPTSQFQIKIKETPPRRWRRWVFLGLGLVVVAGGAAVVAYFLGAI